MYALFPEVAGGNSSFLYSTLEANSDIGEKPGCSFYRAKRKYPFDFSQISDRSRKETLL
jgi:hypothetical protein